MVIGGEMVWRLREADSDAVWRLTDTLGISAVVARLLVTRAVTEPEDARLFLDPQLSGLHDPFLLPDMDKAVERISRAIDSKETIFLHGDYDADGVTSAALAYRMLTALGANVVGFVPSRSSGYDLQRYGIDQAREAGATLVLTVDCGSCAVDAVKYAEGLGIEVIVTDHHRCGDELPPVYALVNPYRPDAEVPFQALCGAGVAFKLGDALVSRRMPAARDQFRRRFADLAAIGTVADVTPLVGENRLLVARGLQTIEGGERIGLRALLDSMNMRGKRLDTESIGFKIGPRLNAAGRMEDADLAFRLLTTRDETEAAKLADELAELVARTQQATAQVTTEALVEAMLPENENRRILVLARERWAKGVVGIACNRIVDHCRRPVILLSYDEKEDSYHGSARSWGDFRVLDALNACADLLGRYGGHSKSAGLSLPAKNLDAFRDRVDQFAREAGVEVDTPPILDIDAEITHGGNLSFDLIEQIERMAPFGNANPEPIFMTRNALVLQARAAGKDNNTFLAHFKLPGMTQGIKGVWFKRGDFASQIEMGSTVDIAYTPKINEFNGRSSVELSLKDIKLAE